MHTETFKGLFRVSMGGFAALFLTPGILAAPIPAKADGPDLSSTPFPGDDVWEEDALTVGAREESPQDVPRRDAGPRRVYGDRVTPHWFRENTRFWYRNDLRDGAKEFVLVDTERGARQLAFDHAKLASALSRAAGTEHNGAKLPFNSIAFVDDARAVAFKVNETTWKCDLASYECSRTDTDIIFPPVESAEEGGPFQRRRSGTGQRQRDDADASPDGKWTAFVKDHNVFIKSREDETREVRLSQDGKDGLAYGRFSWSPDSKTLVALRVEPGERKEVHLIQSSPEGGGRAKLQTRPYPLPGDKFANYELNIFEIAGAKQIKPELDRFEHEWLTPRVRWKKDGRHLMYQQTDRGHQRLRVIEVDSQTGKARNLIDEQSKTFIWTAHTENLNLSLVNWLEQTDEIIYVSESSGWRHLYLIDAGAGATAESSEAALRAPSPLNGERAGVRGGNAQRLSSTAGASDVRPTSPQPSPPLRGGEGDAPRARLKNAITSGDWVVRGIDLIDETNRHVWFRASGVVPGQDPYLMHYGRVNFDGSGLVWLTAGDGNHTVQYSPDRKFLIDTRSRVDLAPVAELRRVSDGKLVCKLEEADITDLQASGWQPPEVFAAKGRDGKTDIWGIISRPPDLDPNRKYPVIEDIYAGPQGSFVPKTFSATSRYESLTRLGFIVVKIDGMGTANRSKAFHDVCWHNLKDGGFEDRILWMKAAAKKYPYMDLARMGVYGNSAGGQNAAAAVLFHPEFYKVAVASCGCHDNRMDKASWNEQWMGYPVGPQYSECSNIDNAHRLQGKLFLIVGEMDTNVPPESTMRFVDALIKARKDFDLLVIPGGGHGMGGAYGQRRMQDFFVRNLLGVEPPDRNAARAEQSGSGGQ